MYYFWFFVLKQVLSAAEITYQNNVLVLKIIYFKDTVLLKPYFKFQVNILHWAVEST